MHQSLPLLQSQARCQSPCLQLSRIVSLRWAESPRSGSPGKSYSGQLLNSRSVHAVHDDSEFSAKRKPQYQDRWRQATDSRPPGEPPESIIPCSPIDSAQSTAGVSHQSCKFFRVAGRMCSARRPWPRRPACNPLVGNASATLLGLGRPVAPKPRTQERNGADMANSREPEGSTSSSYRILGDLDDAMTAGNRDPMQEMCP